MTRSFRHLAAVGSLSLLFASFAPAAVLADQGAEDPTSDVSFRTTPLFQGQIMDNPSTRAMVHELAVTEDAETLTLAVTTHTVVIRVAGDEEWRAYYGSTLWDDRANDAVEAADNATYSQFAIDLVAVEFVNWDSAPDSGTCGQVLDDLELEGLGGNDVLMGFSKQTFSAGGCSEGDYVLVRYQGPTNDWKVTQHEVSHLYGADDVAGGTPTHPDDVMEDPYNGANSWCTYLSGPGWDHFGTLQLNSGKYD